jgi:hypothetical protein
MTKEIWRPYTRFACGYEISSRGRVRSYQYHKRGRILKPWPSTTGHLLIRVGSRTAQYVHVLVLETFKGPRPSKRHESRHLNGRPADNRLSNLEWATKSRNHQDVKWHRGQRGYKLNPAQVREIANALAAGAQGRILAKRYKVGEATISRVKHALSHTDVLSCP